MGKKREGAAVGGHSDRPENSDWAIHSVSQQTFPAPKQIRIPFAWEEKQRER